MKKIALTGLVVMIGYQLGFAQSFYSTSGWECEHYTTGNQTYIVGPNGVQDQVTVPSSVYDPNNLSTYTVTQLGNGQDPVWNDNMSALTTPSTLESINSYSCAYLPYLAIVNIGGQPTIEWAFAIAAVGSTVRKSSLHEYPINVSKDTAIVNLLKIYFFIVK